MDQDNIYNQLKKMLASAGGKYNILEEQIDLELQVEFFELVNKLMKEKDNTEYDLPDEEKLYHSDIDGEEKKRILAKLSNYKNPEAYRIIERFIDSNNKTLNSWAILALQHSRISLETHLLDEQQVFISTGLGGREEKLRYFIVCKLQNVMEISVAQKKLVQTEFEVSFKAYDSVVEKISFFDNYFSVLGLIPIDKSINNVIESAIKEANNYGGFINEKFLVTNVKILDSEEIKTYF